MKKNLFSYLVGISLMLYSSQISAQDLKTAIRLTQSEQFESASSAYKSLIQKDRNNGDYYYYYAESILQSYFADTIGASYKDAADSAKLLYIKGIQAQPLNPLNYVGLGKIALFSGDINCDITNMDCAKNYFDIALTLIQTKPDKTDKTINIVAKDGLIINYTKVSTKENISIVIKGEQPTVATKDKTFINPTNRQALVYAKIAQTYIQSPKKDIQQALSLLQTAQQLDPTNPEIFIITGDAYLEINDGSNAIANYKKAQELAPKSPVAKMKIGNIYVRSKSLKVAIPYFEEALQIDSTFAPVYRELGELYYKAQLFDKAKNSYEKYIELSSYNISAKIRYIKFLFLSKNYSDALIELNEIFAVDTSSNVLNRIASYCYYETGNYNDALKYIEKFISKSAPDKTIASDYAYYARTLAKLGKDSLAIEQFQQALKRDSTDYKLMSDMASSFTKLKNYEEAIKIYEYKIRKEQAEDLDYYNLGKCYYQLKQWGKADTTYNIFIQKQPTFMPGIIMQCRSKANMDTAFTIGTAKSCYDKVIQIAQTDSVKYMKELIEAYDYSASYSLFIMQDKCEAKKYFQRIIAIDPNNEKAKSALASKELKLLKCN